jgi:lipopolysaccharide/colanic/teichoic acid biosynthesis glycosyltransferase
VVGPLEELDPVPADTLAALGRDSRVHLIGENRDTPPLYAAMDIFCLPTYTEGMPVAPLEAAAMGLAVVATQVSGCVDAVQDGVTGTLVPSRDAHALAAALEAYLVNAPVRHDHGAAGRDRMLREFRPEALWNAQAAEYARLLQGSGLPLPAALPFKGQYSGSPLFRNGSRVTRTAGDGHDGSGLTTHHGGPVDQRQRIRDVIRVNETGLPWRRPGLGRRAKRAIDLVGGTAAAIVALPIMAAVGIGVAATSRGPVVLKQERVGLDGRAFTMWKFRSMRADYPDGQARGRGEVVRTDPRLTPIGRFLRDWRLDELPQLFQVIRGQMSLIGPRPDLPANLPAYADDELLRFAMPPGCTAWTFTRGLFENDWRTRQLIHVEYVRQWSLWLDLKILAGTAWVLLRQQATSPTTAETPRSESEAR